MPIDDEDNAQTTTTTIMRTQESSWLDNKNPQETARMDGKEEEEQCGAEEEEGKTAEKEKRNAEIATATATAVDMKKPIGGGAEKDGQQQQQRMSTTEEHLCNAKEQQQQQQANHNSNKQQQQQLDNNPLLLSANKYQDRSAASRQSTGTLNRLMLVAQVLENEVDWRRRNDVNSTRVVFTLRTANIVLLMLINLLMFSGVGQYHDREGARISLFLTMDKWHFQPGYPTAEVPSTFAEMRLTGQFCAVALSIAMLLSTILLQCIHCLHFRHSKFLCIFYAIACVPATLFIFGLEMHYSACPWLDDFYHSQVLKKDFNSMEKYFDTQCGINGWALAGIFSLLSCGLFVSDGLISAFFRADDLHGGEMEKPEAML